MSQEYLSIISNCAYTQIFLDAYLLQVQPRESVFTTAPANRLDQAYSVTEEAPAEPTSAFPMVQPMKAALYFDSANGFGEWRIFLSTRATGHLREWRRNDASTFKIIVKKIK